MDLLCSDAVFKKAYDWMRLRNNSIEMDFSTFLAMYCNFCGITELCRDNSGIGHVHYVPDRYGFWQKVIQ